MHSKSLDYVIAREALFAVLGASLVGIIFQFVITFTSVNGENSTISKSFRSRVSQDKDVILLQTVLKSWSNLDGHLNVLKEVFPEVVFCVKGIETEFSNFACQRANQEFSEEIVISEPEHLYLKFSPRTSSTAAAVSRMFDPKLIIMLGLFSLFIPVLIYRRVTKLFRDPAARLDAQVQQILAGMRGPFNRNSESILEWEVIQKQLELIASYIGELEKKSAIAAKANMARQVAHDIRSPLAALNMVVDHAQELPEENRVLIRMAIQRINDIANDLLAKSKAILAGPQETEGGYFKGNEMLAGLIDALVTEKRMQYRSKMGVSIEFVMDSSAYGLCAKVGVTEFKRCLSNILDNAVESLKEQGRVVVSLKMVGGKSVIDVKDNGCGMPEELLKKLGTQGVTFGKKVGSGLGFHYTKEKISEMGGRISVSSTAGKGTTVSIELPKAETPDWFLNTLKVRPNLQLVVVDDDQSIHNVWKGRFKSFDFENYGIEVVHFSNPVDFAKNVDGFKKESVLLMDYEFLGFEQTGLDLIEKYQLSQRAILVTSRYEEESVKKRCERLKVKLIPKGLAAFVPISISEK